MFHKPLQYTLLQDDNLSKQYAGWLRETFTPLLKKRMPTVYYSGFSHRFIPEYITKHKKQYPYFIRTDLAKFYPSIPHKELIVATQLAYKKVIGLDYVPRRFKPKELLQGKSVNLEGLGTFRLSLSSDGAATEKDFNANMIKGAKIIFTPSVEIKNILEGIKYERA